MKLITRIALAILLAVVTSRTLAECDVEAGRKQYNKCVACHSTEPGVQLMGPSLHGLFGRQVGTEEGFQFSEAMGNADFTWTPERLSAFITNPMQDMPGTVMPFGGIRKEEQREALNCYLQQLN